MQHQLQPLLLLQLSQVHRFQTQPLVQPVMTQHHQYLLILRDLLKQSLLQLKPQLRLLPLPVLWLLPQLLLPVLLPQQVLLVEWVAVPAVAVVDHRLHHLTVDVQKVPRAKKAKEKASQNR